MPLRPLQHAHPAGEPFEPIRPGHATLYTCGPTIWNYAHIGNFRTFLFEDLLRRWLIASGFKVFQVMNLTDVDDRIIREASAKGVAIGDFTAPYAEAFQQDRKWLRIQDAEEYPARHRVHCAHDRAGSGPARQGCRI
jgi:cysteinyl-tRNA synthetase